MLPDEEPGPEQIKILRAMSGVERLQQAENLYWTARRLKLAGLRHQHPDWTEQRLEEEVRRIFLHARS